MLVRYAETPDDVVQVHRFGLVYGLALSPTSVDAVKCMAEALRVARDEVVLLAELDGVMVGTMGLIKVETVPWYSSEPLRYFTNRWFFVAPAFKHSLVTRALRDEAEAIASLNGLPFVMHRETLVRNNRLADSTALATGLSHQTATQETEH